MPAGRTGTRRSAAGGANAASKNGVSGGFNEGGGKQGEDKHGSVKVRKVVGGAAAQEKPPLCAPYEYFDVDKCRARPYGCDDRVSKSKVDVDAEKESMLLLREAYQSMNLSAHEELDPETKQIQENSPRNFPFPREGFKHVCGTDLRGRSVYEQARSVANGRSFRDANETPLDAPIPTLKDKWRLLPYFLEMRGLMRQHIDSFDHFVNTEIKKIVKSPSACEIRSDNDPHFFMRYTDCWVGEPIIQDDSYIEMKCTPFQCRMRDCTYSAPIYVDLVYIRGHKKVIKRRVQIGRMPIMLKSSKCVLRGLTEEQSAKNKECPYDPGGYFVIKGVEKVILMQEQLSKNRVIIEEDNKKCLSASITSSTHERKSRCNILINGGKIFMKNNTLGDEVSIVLILKAMGMECDKEIVDMVGNEKEIVDAIALSLEDCAKHGIRTQKQALRYVGQKIRSPDKRNGMMGGGGRGGRGHTWYKRPQCPEDEAREVLANVVLSHVPVVNFDFRPKCLYIGYIMRRLLLVHLGKAKVDDKDYYGNKRLELAGQLLSLLFEDLFKHFNKVLKKEADMVLSKPNRVAAFDITKCIRTDLITNGMVNAIATGNWVLKRFRMDRAGVTQVLSRLSYISALGMMTRVNSQFEKTRKVSGPRSLQPSQWGMLCPADTPEGEACGLVKNLALLSHITTDEEIGPVMRLCYDCGVVDISSLTGPEINFKGSYLVILNGLVVGAHLHPQKLVKQLRIMRRKGTIGEFVSIYLSKKQRVVHIACDGGRVCRPLLVVENGKAKLTQVHLEALSMGSTSIQDLLMQGCVEYVDVNEENNCLIAVTEKNITENHTHLEIDPLSLLGVVAGLIPFPHHNQSPRNTYQAAMGKQAMGTVSMNQYERIDSLIYTMVYPMKPMVKTRTLDLVNFDKIPGGQNACIAVMSYSGYDIEDAIVLNKASLERGFGRCMVLKKQQIALKTYPNGHKEGVEQPPNENLFDNGKNDKRYKKYQALDLDGIANVGAKVDSGDILINKSSPVEVMNNVDSTGQMVIPGEEEATTKPTPVYYKNGQQSIVDKVILTSNETEAKIIKINLRQTRMPEIGDKFSR